MSKEEKVIDTKPIVKKEEKVKKPISEKIIIFGIIAAILVVAFGIFGFYFYKTSMLAVATYDGGKVTKSEFAIYYKTFQPMLTYYGYPESMIPDQIANKAALDEIILKEAKKEGVKIPEDRKKEIDEQFNDQEQLKQLEAQGINAEQMKQLYYSDAIISAYIDKKVAEADDNEVIEYIKANNENPDLTSFETSHILFKTTGDTGAALSDEEKAAKKAKAEETLNRVKAGEDFAALAKELSEDTGTKDDGGNYTVYMDNQTEENYANAVKGMKAGDVVLVESAYGYHVIKLNNIVENGRAKSENDREAYVNEKINKISDEKHFEIKKENLAKAVEQITGKSSTKEENKDGNTNESTSEENTNATETTTTENTENTEKTGE